MKLKSIIIDNSVLSGIIATSNRATIAQHPIFQGAMMIDLAMRAVACKGWEWVDGMATTDGGRLCAGLKSWDAQFVSSDYSRGVAVPDFYDPATLGCLLALVRDAVNDPHAHVEFYQGEWCVQWQLSPDEDSPFCLVADSEAAALVAALEYAHAQL